MNVTAKKSAGLFGGYYKETLLIFRSKKNIGKVFLLVLFLIK